MMYVYVLGVIEKHGTGDTNDVFVCEHRGDMNRLSARLNKLTAENAKLREENIGLENQLDKLNRCVDSGAGDVANLHAKLAEAKRLLRNVTQAHENDLYFRMDEAHEWLLGTPPNDNV